MNSEQEQSTEAPPRATIAIVEWLRGNRGINRFMRSAGLGLDGVGVKERITITYKPGEVVTEARVLDCINKMIREADEQNMDFEIQCPAVLYIGEAP